MRGEAKPEPHLAKDTPRGIPRKNVGKITRSLEGADVFHFQLTFFLYFRHCRT